MSILILGLLIFLSVHSVRIVAEGWRKVRIARMGEKGWKVRTPSPPSSDWRWSSGDTVSRGMRRSCCGLGQRGRPISRAC